MQPQWDHDRLGRLTKERAKTFVEPFLSDDVMDGPPDCSVASFRTPRLRRARHLFSSIDWTKSERLGAGLDGCVWKVWFGEDGPYALKMFWEAEPSYGEWYWATQRECQNAALFQMMDTAVLRGVEESIPVLVSPSPADRYDAVYNIDCFADEIRREKLLVEGNEGPDAGIPLTSLPRMAKCYGWLKFSSEEYHQVVPPRNWAPDLKIDKFRRRILSDLEYTAIVFEYIKDGPNDPDMAVEVDNFLYHAGFGYNYGYQRNWRRGVLVDHSDYVHPRGYGWQKWMFGPRKASDILAPNLLPEPPSDDGLST